MNHPNSDAAAPAVATWVPHWVRLRAPRGLPQWAAGTAGRLCAILLAVAGAMPAAHPAHGAAAVGTPAAVPEPAPGQAAIAPVVTAVMGLPAVPSRQPFGTPLAAAGLVGLRGGTLTPSSDMHLHGTVGQNVATNVVTGANIVSDGAFSNASGLPMVIQNSGANVLIQNATIVNVQFQ